MGYFDKFKYDGIPFMDGAEKGDFAELDEQKWHIVDFGFINGRNGEYAVIKLAEKPGKFYFCNEVITSMLRTIRDDGAESELAEQPVKFYQKTSKANGQRYWSFEF